jgi:hypothetical protein
MMQAFSNEIGIFCILKRMSEYRGKARCDSTEPFGRELRAERLVEVRSHLNENAGVASSHDFWTPFLSGFVSNTCSFERDRLFL